ncbi:protein NUCLEAR FUSION DEFECTIVE 4-like [Abrus precatorius]|uniref:Protein NUCLEAR FUSION DEFECTIVE 4-like n=1 Tax=Abrus precatorius TaxID=3816 RepID=A0A8B8JW66_ABRPR|nr:protein NUCLEAR FUSION DEFECTIVE 4-like [Abrus precatorius]
MEFANLNLYLNSKWLSVVASIWIQCTSGSLYTFSIYSQTLKSTQHYDQSTLDVVSVSKDIGANVGVLSGLIYDFFARRTTAGPWLVHFLGLVQCFLGYFLMWAAVAGLFPPLPVPLMCLFMFVAAHAQSYFNTSNVVTGVHNFPNYSGTIVGIMKGFLGLSGAILILVYRTIFNNKPTLYLLMLALLPPINTLLLMWFVRIHKTRGGEERKYLNVFSLMALVIAAYLMVVIILENVVGLQSFVRIFVFAVLMVLLASLFGMAFKAQERNSSGTSENFLDEQSQLIAESGPEKVDAREDSSDYPFPDSNNQRTSLQQGENLNLIQAVQTVNFWVLFISMAFGMGSGLATVNNLGQIGESLGYSSHETGSLVSLWSIWNFLGRFGAGYVSDYFLHTRGWARPLFMVNTLMIMSIGHVVIASGLPGALYGGSILVGICYGSQWSLMPTITSEIFGVGHMGSIFNTITIANPVGSYIFSVRVVGYIYDKEASEGNTCIGTHCFMLSFLIMASATFLGSVTALCLFLRTKNFYDQIIRRRIQNVR